MLIRSATLLDRDAAVCVRIGGKQITAVARTLEPRPGEPVVEARGNLLLPGLHDHHMHLLAFAASLDSLRCGPPDIGSDVALARQLSAANRAGPGEWLRGIAYHPAVAGEIDRDWLDQHIPDRPVRIQHRGGRLWVLNSAALRQLGVLNGGGPAGLEYIGGRPSGRLYDEDNWLREQLGNTLPDIDAASRHLAGLGITSITDTGPANGPGEWTLFARLQNDGQLRQSVRMMGDESLQAAQDQVGLQRGELKIHLLESALPDYSALVTRIRNAHREDRAVAIHCVTLAELEFSLGAWREAGVLSGDRIEHGSVIAPTQLEEIANLGLRIVTQPHFISERGDQYRADITTEEQRWLYRCRSLRDCGIPLAFGSDAPFGGVDPWRSMQAAVTRRTRAGVVLGDDEPVTARQALVGYLFEAEAPGVRLRRIENGATADLCLLDAPWSMVAKDLCSDHVARVWINGALVYDRGQ